MTDRGTAFDALVSAESLWRFPRLALLSERAPTADSAERLRCLAEDLATQLPPTAAIDLLVGSGALNLADKAVGGLLDEGFPDEWAEAKYEEIETYEAARREGFERRRRAAAARCHRAGIKAPDELTMRVNYRRADETFLAELFSLLESQVSEAEAEKEQELRCRLRDADLGSRQREDISDLIQAGELRLASDALEDGDDRVLLPPPQMNEQPWLHLTEPLPRILRFLDDPELRPPSYNAFVPPPDDIRGNTLLTALAELAQGVEGAESMFADAVQRLIANWDVQTEVVDGITYAELYLPEVGRLPPLQLRQGQDTVRFAVGLAGGTARFRLSTQVSEIAAGVVDISSLLGLLTQDGTRGREREDRLVLFYRALCRQLNVREVVDADSFRGSSDDIRRLRVAWLFYLLGYQISSYQLTALMDLTGGIPELIVTVAELAVIRARELQTDLAVSSIYEDEELDGRVVDAVAADLDDPETELLVYLALAGSLSVDAAHGALRQVLDSLEPPVTINSRYIVDLPSALATGQERGYLHGDTDEFQVVPVGGLLLLPREQLDARVRDLSTICYSRFRGTRRRVALERAQADLDEMAWHAQRSVERASLQGSTDASARVALCCRDACSAAREGHASVTVLSLIDIDEELQINIDGFMLRSAVLNLINNAAEAVHGQEGAAVRVVGSVDQGIVTILVEDNGPGFADDIVASFNDGAQVLSSKHEGRGSGLETGRVIAEDLGGRLTVSRSELGGAAVTMWFPTLKPQSTDRPG